MSILRNIKISYHDNENHTYHEKTELQLEVDGDSAIITFLAINDNGNDTNSASVSHYPLPISVDFKFNQHELKRALNTILFYHDHGIYDKSIGIGDDMSVSIDYSVDDDGTVDITLFIFHNDYYLYVDILDARAMSLML